MNKRIAFITGATSGIGEATARLLAKNNFKLILCGRRQDRLKELAQELELITAIKTLSFDVRNQADVKKEIESLDSAWKSIDVLLNNAGNAHGLDPIQSGSTDDWDAMMDINVKGLLYVSKEIMPGMVERKAGHIINIGSIAGKEVYEKGNVYCASKFAVDAITKSMRIDLLKHGIKVTGIHPGAVETEFSLVRYKGDEEKADAAYTGFVPLTAKDIADTIFYCATLPAHVCINELVITCLQQAGTYYFYKK